MAQTFTITSEPHYDAFSQCYFNALIVSIMPAGPLQPFIGRLKEEDKRLIQTKTQCMRQQTNKCLLAIRSMDSDRGCRCNWMTSEEVPDLISFLLAHGYQMETQITNMLNQTPLSRQPQIVVTYTGTQPVNITYMR